MVKTYKYRKVPSRKETQLLLPGISTTMFVDFCEGEKHKLLPYRRDDCHAEFSLTIERYFRKGANVMLDAVNEKPKKTTGE